MKEIQIGNQIWASENLKTTTFRNGESIPQITNPNEWASHIGSALTIIDGNYFYNFDTVIDPRNVAPAGWRVPTENDWMTLVNFVGTKDNAGHKLKSTEGWSYTGTTLEGETIVQDFGGTDEFNFSAIPTGFVHINGNYSPDPQSPYFIPESIKTDLAKYVFAFMGQELGFGGMWKKDGFPIRLIKES